MAFKRYADARWQGDLQASSGSISTPQSGLFADQNFSFKTRFGDQTGTNPEELLAAAHAGCFSMALSAVLGKAGFVPDEIRTRAEVTMEPGMDRGPPSPASLVLAARVPGSMPPRSTTSPSRRRRAA